jgi:hypothetical protein
MRSAFALHNLIRFESAVAMEKTEFNIFDNFDDRSTIKPEEVYEIDGKQRNPAEITDFPTDSIFHVLSKLSRKRKRDANKTAEQNFEDDDLLQPNLDEPIQSHSEEHLDDRIEEDESPGRYVMSPKARAPGKRIVKAKLFWTPSKYYRTPKKFKRISKNV